jgi:hypothetical protein
MKDSALLSLDVGEDVPGKLAELAEEAANSGHFLTQLIRLLYGVQQSSSERLQLEQFLSQVPYLIDRHREQEEIIRRLRSSLRRLSQEQAELLAVNHLLIDASPEFRNSSLHQNLQ